MTESRKSQQADERVEDLEVGGPEAEGVQGGKKVRKAGGGQQDYYDIKLQDVQVSSFQSGGTEGSNT